MDTVEKARALDHRMVGWVAASGLAHRALLLVASLTAVPGMLGRWSAAFTVVGSLAMAGNAALAFRVSRGRRPRMLESRLFLVADVLFAVALNLAATLALPAGTVLLTGRDVFWQYMLGTVVVWTSLRGVRYGTALWAGGTLLEFSMVAVNGVHLTGTGAAQVAGRVGWLFAGLLVPAVIMAFATRGTRLATAESVTAGREAERARALSDLHDTALQTYAQIAGRAVDATRTPASRLADIRRMAGHEMRRAGEAVSRVDRAHPPRLVDGLRLLVSEFGSRGLEVRLRSQRLRSRAELPPGETEALLAATREALNNVLRHARVDRADVLVREPAPDLLSIEVLDEGRGIDAASASRGFGLEHSLKRRIHDVGGTVRIVSAPGRGTGVTMTLPHPERRRTSRYGLGTKLDPKRGSLEDRALGWFVIPALTYRACLTPLQVALALATLPHPPSGTLLGVMGGVLLADLLLLATARSAAVARLFRSRAFLICDFTVAAGLNIWVALDLPPGTALLPGRQFLWGYVFGTVILWTALRGPRPGAVLLAAGCALQAAVILVNHDALDGGDMLLATANTAKLLAAFVISWLITLLARQGVRLAAKAGEAAGREMERAEELRQLHEEVMAGLASIIELRPADAAFPEDVLQKARGVALQQMSRLRGVLRGGKPAEPVGLRGELGRIVDSFRQAGLRVEFVTAELGDGQPQPVIDALARSSHAALENVLRYSGAAHVVVWAADAENSTEIVVRDQGIGFPEDLESGVTASAIDLAGGITLIGGSVRVRSAPEWGTRVVIRVPHSPSPSPAEDDVPGDHQHDDDQSGRQDQQDAEPDRPRGALADHSQRAGHLPHGLEHLAHRLPSPIQFRYSWGK